MNILVDSNYFCAEESIPCTNFYVSVTPFALTLQGCNCASNLWRPDSNTIIDNIFSNVINPDIILGNLTATISDHLLQFAIIPNMFDNIS